MEKRGKKVRVQSSCRQAFVTTDSAPATAKAQLQKRGSMSKTRSDDIKPNQEMLERIRDK